MPNKRGGRATTSSRTDKAVVADEQHHAPLTRGMLCEFLQETLRDILSPMLNEAIQPLMLEFENKLRKRVDDLGKELRPAVAVLKASVAEQGESIETVGVAMESMQVAIAELERRYNDLQEKMTSFVL